VPLAARSETEGMPGTLAHIPSVSGVSRGQADESPPFPALGPSLAARSEREGMLRRHAVAVPERRTSARPGRGMSSVFSAWAEARLGPTEG